MCVAQNPTVLPPSRATVEGSGSTNVPFGRSVPMRTQLAYDRSLFDTAVVASGIAMRLDGGATSRGKKAEVELRACTMPVAITSMQARFEANLGSDLTVVLDRQIIDLPAHTQPSSPNPFTARLPFTRPFAFDPTRGSLLLEVLVHGQPPGPYTLDTTYLCESPRESYGPDGCGSNGKVLRAESATTQVLWGKRMVLRVFDAQPSAPTMLFLGTLESGAWGNLRLPVDLGPVGAPGCWLSIDMLVQRSVRADATGVALYPINVPSLPHLQGQWIRFQGASMDAQANPLGVTTSQAGKVQICGWQAVARVYAPKTNALTGFRELGIAPVIELMTQ